MGISLYWINGTWPGRLAVAARPRGGDWIESEIRSWRDSGLDEVVSLLTPDEVAEFTLDQEEKWCKVYGIRFRAFSIPDRGVPASVDKSEQVITGSQSGRSLSASHFRSLFITPLVSVAAG